MSVNGTLTTSQNPSQWIEWLKFGLTNLLFPFVVAVGTYIIVDRLGEYRKRRLYSRLGVAVMEALLEEVNNGVRLLSKCYMMIKTNKPNPSLQYLPTGTWGGTSTIQDEVLLRILATSSKRHFEKGFPPNQCRIHCKNYFEFVCGNYNNALKEAGKLAAAGQDWRPPLMPFVGHKGYPLAARNVRLMLEHAKELLEENSEKWLPK
jgi:hypothetical protein